MSPGRIAVVGSGFAGSILARIARRLGHEVTLVERGRHPRFALGESSTPLGNLALRRLGERYGLADLVELSSHGRWLAAHPGLRRGLKRGFTFFAHRPGRPFDPGAGNRNRLLVAASPNDEVADTHWLRADVDAFLARRASAEGVRLLEATEVTAVERRSRGLRLLARGPAGESLDVVADLVVDASGAGGMLARSLPIAPRRPAPRPASGLVAAHFTGLAPFARTVPGGLEPGPYPDERAAVHHLLREGWVYVLPFDHGVASVGWIRPHGRPGAPGATPEERLRTLFARYASLAEQFEAARPATPFIVADRLQHRLARAAGRAWVLLPHAYAFFDPLFSTGIAWSLLGVERLARLLEEAPAGAAAIPPEGLDRYARLLSREADRIEALIAAAYAALDRPELLFSYSLLYFAAASWAEIRQRIEPEAGERAAWEGFLGVGDRVIDDLFARGGERLERELAGEEGALSVWVPGAIAGRDLVGLADSARRNLHPADLEAVVERSALLGRTRAEMRALGPRLLAV